MPAIPVAVVEGAGAAGSIQRAFYLMKGFVWQGLGLLVIVGLIAFCIGGLFGTVGSCLQLGVTSVGAPAEIGLVLDVAVRLLGDAITVPLVCLALVLFYYDLRIRKEAFDLQMLAEQLGYSSAEVPAYAGH